MSMPTTTIAEDAAAPRRSNAALAGLRAVFLRVGVLPFFLVATLIAFSLVSKEFLALQNLTNVARQSVYLILVSLGQMLALLTGGFDLSVGTAIALTSVVSALAMVSLSHLLPPDMLWLVIVLGCCAGLAAALVIGSLNGLGVAVFGVSPFIMTLGVQSVGAGIALFLTGGVPVSGIPYEFGDALGFGRVLDIPVPVLVAIVAAAAIWLVMNRTRLGKHIQAVGGNVKAARLSGVNTTKVLFIAYALCALLASVAGLLLTARVGSGETNLGGTIALESIAACVIAGVSLHGGIGRVENVVLGGFFIVLLQNGMNIAQIGSYMQMVLLGSLLVLAVILDQFRYRLLVGER
ncbi:ABC transporter permease [Bradyrhizobium ontarionense]|uniref:ABC transporter permease n=1 Tax=Bradyrhizobium ontarionense TaxID=2898149 RepID=A0ABY3RIG2_9BRAD|nr:ABC transporter permease [Bradyrhizobium sp. A19]UFZ07246.1 ABC transporter permease [Bradyrhizobium sp. A19]